MISSFAHRLQEQLPLWIQVDSGKLCYKVESSVMLLLCNTINDNLKADL